jgi:glutamyl-tRNA synthetase
VKQVVAEFKLKLPKLAMPLRVMVTGTAQTPSIDAVLELIGREEVVRRMDDALARFPEAGGR